MSISRRELLKLGASSLIFVVAGQVLFGQKVSAEVIRRFNDLDLISLLKEMPLFEGTFSIETDTLKLFADDFGHHVHKIPLGVFRPAHSIDIQKMAEFCLAKKIRLTMRGTGGSAYGQTQLQEGIIIDSSSMKKMLWLSQDLIQLEPGLQWREVLDYTIQSNRTPYVLPDTNVISVGGLVNAGGIGETSYTFGSATSHVVEFDLVTIEGLELTCNEEVNTELFHAALGSMGQYGFITRIVLRTMAAPEKVYSRQFHYAGVDYRYLSDLKMITENEACGAIGGSLVRSSDEKTFNYVLTVTYWGEEEPAWLKAMSVQQIDDTKEWSFYDYANRNTKSWQDSIRKGTSKLPHPYLSFQLPYERVQEMSDYLQQTEEIRLGANRMTTVPFIEKGVTAVQFQICRVALDGEGSASHLAMLQINQDVLLPKVFEMGGKAYLPLSPILNETQQLAQFQQNHLDEARLLKQKLDSQNLVNSGAGLYESI